MSFSVLLFSIMISFASLLIQEVCILLVSYNRIVCHILFTTSLDNIYQPMISPRSLSTLHIKNAASFIYRYNICKDKNQPCDTLGTHYKIIMYTKLLYHTV